LIYFVAQIVLTLAIGNSFHWLITLLTQTYIVMSFYLQVYRLRIKRTEDFFFFTSNSTTNFCVTFVKSQLISPFLHLSNKVNTICFSSFLLWLWSYWDRIGRKVL
jgi:hypothetical protein